MAIYFYQGIEYLSTCGDTSRSAAWICFLYLCDYCVGT